MAVTIKSARQIALMVEAGKILCETHDRLKELVLPGITTRELDMKNREFIKSYGCIPSFLDYNGFPASLCVSINDEVVHGIPNKKRRIEEGDIVSLDNGVIYEGWQSDAARTYGVGQISAEEQKLIDVTRESFFEGIKMARAGNHLYDISNAIDDYIKPFGYGIVRELVGHGIGSHLHEDPEVPNFRQKKKGIKLQPGMTLAVEPMVNLGRADVEWLDDGWTVVTADGTPSAHYENTILITDGDPVILSLV